MKRPIALLIDDRYALFPYDLASKKDCTYAVLGFYHIAHAWAERQPADNGKGYVVRWKFAFEWCEKQPAPWWEDRDAAAKDHDDKSASTRRPGVVYRSCAACMRKSPLVYEEGWMCLMPQCTTFWTLRNGSHPPETLAYANSFLSSRMNCEHDPLEDIAPILPATGAGDGVVTSRRFSKGWHCKQCGRLSCRFKWQYWECQNCGTTLTIAGATRLPKGCCTDVNKKFLDHSVLDPAIIVQKLAPYSIPGSDNTGHYHVYVLPECRGKIYLIQGRRIINQIADEIFREYQEQAKAGDLQFRRFPLKSNSGEPYQYIGGTGNTVPFDAAPSAVIKARDLIHSRMMSVMKAESSNPYRFNEVLSAAYMEEQSMSFHSDAETCRCLYAPLPPTTGNLNPAQGDVMIMDGAAIQEYYEHTVVPLNFRIAATARYIGGATPINQESSVLL
ncbi:hypothetical protein C8Q80DRAFT_885446 [Daedaleopsis nitida]|nr:hypothetical protein C8Q80DRAFT_885446 [Daedaleopsis nitida]